MAATGIKRNMEPHEATYTFSSEPRPIQAQRAKYRDPLDSSSRGAQPANIMYDRRIVRGSTYAARHSIENGPMDPIEVQRQQEARRRAIAKKRAQEQFRPRTPHAVAGRKHIDIQTELYLEELNDRVVEKDGNSQTDAFLDRPPTPKYIPAKTGKDVSTQIEEGELFSFDIEVKPILEVLVGKTMEQALIEVMEEEELASLRDRQRAYEELRNAELAEAQRLEEAETRRREEKEKRLLQEKQVRKQEEELTAKLAARSFGHSYLAGLIPSILENLTTHGYFYDTVEREVETEFMPDLINSVEERVARVILGRAVADMLIQEVVLTKEKIYQLESQQQHSGEQAKNSSLATNTQESASEKSPLAASLSVSDSLPSANLAAS
eukprot:Sdes_comp19663_c1_seq1m11510